ncbi:MAG: hypothetical protein AAGJ18_14270 [Bacteroidota bacterium]
MRNKENKTFEVFRNNQHKLNERPSLQAWNKLERRLDQKSKRQTRPRFTIYSLVMMAAAAVALIFFFTTISNVAQTAKYRKAVVINESAPTEKVSTQLLKAEQAFREQHNELLANTVEEGTTGRLLIAKNKAVRPFLIPRKS